jgi:putative Ca2+/H+ antiporter (TMEM165/GDT1 family)
VIVDWKVFALVFGTVFIAELGDKTQLATLLFAADKDVNKWLVFAGAALALIATSALGVLGGTLVSQYVSERTLHVVAGVGFIVIGIWTLWR